MAKELLELSICRGDQGVFGNRNLKPARKLTA
jgi:hypothetical protein